MKEEILKLKITLEKEKEISDTLNISKQYQEIHIKAGFYPKILSLSLTDVGEKCNGFTYGNVTDPRIHELDYR